MSLVGVCVSLSEWGAVTAEEDPFSECGWGVCVHVNRTDSLYDCECSWDVCVPLWMGCVNWVGESVLSGWGAVTGLENQFSLRFVSVVDACVLVSE